MFSLTIHGKKTLRGPKACRELCQVQKRSLEDMHRTLTTYLSVCFAMSFPGEIKTTRCLICLKFMLFLPFCDFWIDFCSNGGLLFFCDFVLFPGSVFFSCFLRLPVVFLCACSRCDLVSNGKMIKNCCKPIKKDKDQHATCETSTICVYLTVTLSFLCSS